VIRIPYRARDGGPTSHRTLDGTNARDKFIAFYIGKAVGFIDFKI
jgi:hypothetical protein